MADIKKILKNMRLNPRNIRFSDICKVVIIILESQDKKAQAIEYIKQLGFIPR
jgi:hypothetical protein